MDTFDGGTVIILLGAQEEQKRVVAGNVDFEVVAVGPALRTPLNLCQIQRMGHLHLQQ